MTYAVLGPKQTFSDLAFQKYIKQKDVLVDYYPTIYQTIEALNDHDYAIVPIENTLDGYVQPTIDTLLEKGYHIIDEIYIPVQFGFVGHVNHLSELKKVYVQFVAKNQCQNFIHKINHAEIIHTESNSETLAYAKHINPGEGAILPVHVLKDVDSLYKQAHITDSEHNETRFVVVGKKPLLKKAKHYKLSLVIKVIEDRPGLLFDVLSIFKEKDINLTAILSRPTKKKMGTYQFFIEMAFDAYKLAELDQTIDLIQSRFSMDILGKYPNRK
ncbi:MAG: prephenate dehydratase domain-containing protein [Acholeplasmataceae bacterium]|jgi:prephenate dehydratase|nr:prephenate dehydratase domain-containing protein [Acholeplasmataceae bacterium]